MKAFKVFNSDMTCRDFRYEVGKTYKHDGEIGLCSAGFHACLKAVDCFNYYSFDPENIVCEVELLGEVIHGDDKSVCSEIKILNKIKWADVLELVNIGKNNTGRSNTGDRNTGHWNTGHWNTGDCNTGDWNTGDRNTGDRNTGDCNTGHRNTGHWNTGDCNTGDFNTNNPNKKRMFNKLFDCSELENIYYPNFLFFDVVKFISHDLATQEEKDAHKEEIETYGGFLKEIGYKEAFKLSWENADPEDRIRIKDIPGFDADIFFEISGIKVDEH